MSWKTAAGVWWTCVICSLFQFTEHRQLLTITHILHPFHSSTNRQYALHILAHCITWKCYAALITYISTPSTFKKVFYCFSPANGGWMLFYFPSFTTTTTRASLIWCFFPNWMKFCTTLKWWCLAIRKLLQRFRYISTSVIGRIYTCFHQCPSNGKPFFFYFYTKRCCGTYCRV